MKKVTLLLIILILILECFFNVANAQTQSLLLEAIVSFDSNIIVNLDNSINVTEKIIYNTGLQEHHGIYRDIYPFSSQGRKMRIGNITVTDENGNPYQFQISEVNGNTRIKIGDPKQTFSGQKIYIIRYHATRAVAQLKDVDEIYWNVTGNEWSMPIYRAQASVILPPEATLIQSACYYGLKGNTNQCQPVSEASGVYIFNAPSTLYPGNGLTIAISFPKGIVTPYSSFDTIFNFFDMYWYWLIAAILPILTLIFSLLNWYEKGRDARGSGVIVPQYDVPDELTPMEVSGIVNEKVSVDNISAEIIYLATKGYLKIRQLNEVTGLIKLFKSTDYELTRLKDSSDLPNDFDRKLLKNLFKPRSSPQPKPKRFGFISFVTTKKVLFKYPSSITNSIPTTLLVQSVKLSDLKNVFYKDASSVVTLVLKALLNKGYYKNLGRMKTSDSSRKFLIQVVLTSVWGSLVFAAILDIFHLLQRNSFPLIVGIFFSIIIYEIIFYFSPAKTEKGVLVKEYLIGLKDYLQIAEKDRLRFHNAPEKKPEIFEKLLPYAMVLGVASIWAKEFEGIYTMPPSWYEGPSRTAFSTVAFSHTMINFSSFTTGSLSSPRQGGSSGSGSSGGGGGGGGGGSW